MMFALTVPKGYKEENWDSQISSVREFMKKTVSWKGDAIQRGLELGS
jgi:hypothetical protein